MTRDLAQRACCAHLRVSYRTVPCDGLNVRGEVVPNGAVRGWWECDSGCGMGFATADAGSRLKAIVDAACEYVAAHRACQGDVLRTPNIGERLLAARTALVAAVEGE